MSSRTRSGGVLEDAPQRLGAAVGDAGDREALDALHVAPVDVGDAGVVVDDQRAHGHRVAASLAGDASRPGRRRRVSLSCGRRTVNRAPSLRASHRPAQRGRRAPTSARPRPRPTGPARLRRHAGREDVEVGEARAVVADLDRRVLAVVRERDADGALAVGAERVERVVDEVADDRRQLGRREARAQARARARRVSVTPRSRAVAVLPSSSATSTGSSIPSPRRPSRSWALAASRAGELDRLLGAAELDQAGDHVQAVGGLVGLGAQRVGQRLAWRRARGRASRPRCGRAGSSPCRRGGRRARRRGSRPAGRGRRRSAARRRCSSPRRRDRGRPSRRLGVVVDQRAGGRARRRRRRPPGARAGSRRGGRRASVISCGSRPSVWRLSAGARAAG